MKKESTLENRKQYAMDFKSVLKVIISVATVLLTFWGLLISYQEYKLNSNQLILTQMEIEKEENSKQPFFSIMQEYSEEKQQYIYSICNTGGEVRYSDINITPILHVKKSNGKGQITNQAFITLHGFYQYEPANENQLLAFSDKWIDAKTLKDLIWAETSDKVLGNEILMLVCGRRNRMDKAESMTGNLIYRVQISYYDYKNESMFEEMWYGRSSDLSGLSEGNNTLFIQEGLEEIFWNGVECDESIESVDSLNLTGEGTVRECAEVVDELFRKWK